MEAGKDSLKLTTKEGKVGTLSKKAAQRSDLLKGTMNDYPNEESVPISDVDEASATKMIEYLEHYQTIEPPQFQKPGTGNNLETNLIDNKEHPDQGWCINFINAMKGEELVNLTVTANYMGISDLLDLCCAKMASMCKDKSEDEIFASFGITEKFTEEEREKIRQENAWIEENI